MAMIQLPPDFKEFLKLLNSSEVQYLVIGGYAVNYYGFARATADFDIWIAVTKEDARRLEQALHRFGFPDAAAASFLKERQIIRMGVPPLLYSGCGIRRVLRATRGNRAGWRPRASHPSR